MFVQRASQRAHRYKAEFGKSRLDEWIKQGLAFRADRKLQVGRRPIYQYGYRHYRRILQLVRLHASGLKDRDVILVQLFIRGYSVAPHEVREALLKEYRKARNKLNAPLRSIYADRQGEIPPKRKKQLRGQLGPADSRLLKTGMVPADDLMIALVRGARSPDTDKEIPVAKLASQSFGLLQPLLNTLAGMLAHDDRYPTDVERTIRKTGARDYWRAICIFESTRKAFRVLSGSKRIDLAAACDTIHSSLLSREISAFFLVMSLKLMASEPI
jgi:hypothetical protein